MTSTVSKALTFASLRLRNLRPPVARRGERTMAQLDEEAEIFVDRWGVPHVYARSLHDLYFLNGYVQAWDRLWQMDFSRRVATGRVAEVLGPEALVLDRFARRVGFQRRAVENQDAISSQTTAVIDAFVAGINAFIKDSARPPLEFQLLECRPELWSRTDVVAISMLVPFTLTPNWDLELLRGLLLENHDPEDIAALEIDHRADVGSAGSHADTAKPLRASEEVLAELKRSSGPKLGRAAGSNAWVLAGSRTTTGKPLLAGDPHLPPSMPNTWHQVHLSAGDIDVIGASIPGIPGVVIGHNRHCAWSVTAGMVDTSDLFIDESDTGELVREKIDVRYQDQPEIEEVYVGSHGPDIGPAVGVDGDRLCLKIVLPDADGLIGPLVDIARASNWREFRDALRTWMAPVLNFVYADANDIGYQLAGQIPVRSSGKGILPNRGNDGEWRGYIPFDELPTSHNPEAGYIVTANHRPVGDDYEHWLGVDFTDGYRAQRISELIESRGKHSPADVAAMQVDVLSPAAREICGALADMSVEGPTNEALDMLRSWDYRLTAESAAACLYGTFVEQFARRLAKRRLGDDADFWLGRSVDPIRQGNGWEFNHAAKVAELLVSRPDEWFSDWDSEILGALNDSEKELTERLGADSADWKYGSLHSLKLTHSLGRDGVGGLFNRGPYEIGGDGQCVNANSVAADGSFEVAYIPGFRQVVDLANINEGHAAMPGGQSGDPFSKHYNDLTPLWLRGQMQRQYFARTDVVRHSESTLRLLPAEGGITPGGS